MKKSKENEIKKAIKVLERLRKEAIKERDFFYCGILAIKILALNELKKTI